MTRSLNKQTWDKLAKEWSVQTPPWRPTVKELCIYEEKISRAVAKKKKPKALVLGATPELRDICAKLKIDTYIADINPNMVRGMNELLEISPGLEPVEICNWLELPYEDESFDVVLCDHGIQHITYDDWDRFLREVRRVIKKQGYFVNSVFSLSESEKISVGKVVDIYRNNLFSREYKYYYMNRLIFSLADHRGIKHLKYCEEVNREYLELLKKKKISQKEYDFLKVPFPINTFKVNIPSKEDIDEAMHKHFSIKSVNVNIEHPDFTAHKIYFLENK